MTGPPWQPETPAGLERAPASGPGTPPKTPRWVVGLGIVLVVLLLGAVLVAHVSGVEHGPGRHGSGQLHGDDRRGASLPAGFGWVVS